MPISPPEHAKKVWSGQILNVWAWDQKLYDGTSTQFECMTRPDTVSVLPFIDRNTVLLTRQNQPHKPSLFIDVPGGRVDPGESQEEAVKRELQEETGYQTKTLVEWNSLNHGGLVRFEERFFIATDVEGGFSTHQDPGEQIELFRVSWDELVQMCLRRELRGTNAMFSILQMAFDPASQERLDQILKSG
jgi:ADP-ribose pyrophosphatase